MFCIGLTGAIASGKSTAAKIFTNLNINVISADKIAREITTNNEVVLQKITQEFGKNILDSEGKLNRQGLRKIIFNDKVKKNWLENLLHPLIRKEIEKLVLTNKSHKNTSSIPKNDKICVIEIPLLSRKNRDEFPYINTVLLITTPTNIQIERLKNRDNISTNDALKIISSQPSQEEYKSTANTIIVNDGTTQDLETKIITLITHSYMGNL